VGPDNTTQDFFLLFHFFLPRFFVIRPLAALDKSRAAFAVFG
jgi:hypothetical protein